MTRRSLPLLFSLGSLFISLLPLRATATSIPIDPATFTDDPAGLVTFNPDGSALIAEDFVTGFTLLTNAPPNEPEVIFAAPGRSLIFDYDFQYGVFDADDSFFVSLLESGIPLGTPYEFLIAAEGVGQGSFDLSGLAGVSQLGIEFTLISGDFEDGSTLLISNLQTVPVPATVLLLMVGLLGIGASGRRRAAKPV